MVEIDTPAELLQQAFSDANLDQARKVDESLQTASTETILTRLKTAIEQDRLEDAELLLQELNSRYQTQIGETATTIASAEVIMSADEVSFETVQSLTSYLGTATDTKLQRSTLLTTAASYLNDTGSVTDPQTVIETVSTTKQQEQTFTTETETAQSTVEDSSLPPKLTISGVELSQTQVALGETLTATVGVINAGDEPATTLTVAVSLPEGLAAVSDNKTINELPGGTDTTVEFSVTGETLGQWIVEVTADGSNVVPTSANSTIVVTENSDGFSLAEFDRDDDGEIGFDDLRFATREYNRENITFEELRRVLRAYNTDQQV